MAALGGFVEFFQKGKLNPKKTFRPKKKFEPGTMKYCLHKQAQASLNSGINLRAVVKLPPGEDMNDWIAVHVVDFFNRINLIYGTVCEYCTNESCPTMSGGPKFEYLWVDGLKYKKPTSLPANQYISLLIDWIESQINNENIFPVTVDVPFPKSFTSLCKKILTRLFRVFVHVYIHHFDRIVSIGAEAGRLELLSSTASIPHHMSGVNSILTQQGKLAEKEAHVNTCYKHYYYFVNEFHLINPKELEPLKEMTSKMCFDSDDPFEDPRGKRE